MKLLEERIRKDGEVLDGNVLKINSFLNHQVDPQLMMEVGKEFNVTRERIRQIEAKALRKLRHPSRSRKLKDYLD